MNYVSQVINKFLVSGREILFEVQANFFSNTCNWSRGLLERHKPGDQMDLVKQLPQEIVIHLILPRLDYTSWVQAACVCRAWWDLFRLVVPPPTEIPWLWLSDPEYKPRLPLPTFHLHLPTPPLSTSTRRAGWQRQGLVPPIPVLCKSFTLTRPTMQHHLLQPLYRQHPTTTTSPKTKATPNPCLPYLPPIRFEQLCLYRCDSQCCRHRPYLWSWEEP